jgi:arthrofactin-type cyclic lipopeptide synthetase C
MMRLPDVREVGAVVSAAVSAGTPVSAARTAALTTLRTGDPGAAPLLCLPGAGATVVGFHALIGELPAAMPVYGLQPRGVDSDHLAHATVEAAAAAHLAEIGHLTAAGPVHLLGHSFGGWQAYELACAITARGGQVASLSLLDCEPPATVDAVVEVRDLDALLDLVALYGDLAGTPLGLHRADLAPLGDTERRVLLHARMAEVGLVPPKSPPDLIAGPVRTFTRCLRTTYAPRGTYAGPVGLVLVDDAAKDADANRADHQELLRGWRRLAPAVELWRGPGTHMTMLAAPHVAAIADHLTRTGLTC